MQVCFSLKMWSDVGGLAWRGVAWRGVGWDGMGGKFSSNQTPSIHVDLPTS